ncbi:ATP-dependent DNA helicase [Methanocalculus chunghsingensis]|uniref:ATP-dependent DNA helicase n=1 Tax=Methanocalculus chunghsingensis TaxID=156457 RepID=UPI001B8D8E90
MTEEHSSGNEGVPEGDLDLLPIPEPLRERYAAAGITALYPPQITCISEGLFEGRNLLITIPTASGKTLVAEMAMHHQIAQGGKCLYVVPLKALASEKYEDFSGKGVRVGIATGDFDRKDERLGRSDIIVATSEKVDSLLRNRAGWIDSVSLIVLDEVHLIGDESRGATLEMVITTMRSRNPAIQVIGLSATIGNPKELAKWLDAGLVDSAWRPVSLREGVYYKGRIAFDDGEREVPSPKKDADTNLCLDTIAEGGQALVFVSSRRNAEGTAKRISAALRLDEPELTRIADAVEGSDDSSVGETLALCIRHGAAFHHAGLSRDVRRLVEDGFRRGAIRVIASTPTLAAGLNLPARRVIIRDIHRFQAGEGMVPIPVREYRQMAGRAGRPGLDPYGEAILIGKDPRSEKKLFEEFIHAQAEDIDSQCAKRSTLLSRILALVATREAGDTKAVTSFFRGSFYATRHKNLQYLDRLITRVIRDLEEMEMIVDLGSRLEATQFGELTSRLYLDPRSAVMIADQLRGYEREGQETITPFGILHLLSATPDMFRLYLRSADAELIETVAEEREGEFLIGRAEDACPWLGYEEIACAIKNALVLENWIDEVPIEMITERFGIGPGDIHGVVEGILWLIHATREICRREIPALSKDVCDLEIRVKNGVKEELLPLIRLRGIGRIRARQLFNSGYTTPEALGAAGIDQIAPIIGRKTAESILDQISGTSERGRRKKKKDTGTEDDTMEMKKGVSALLQQKGRAQQSSLDFWESGEE